MNAPTVIKKGDTTNVVVAAIHKGCPSSSGRSKKG